MRSLSRLALLAFSSLALALSACEPITVGGGSDSSSSSSKDDSSSSSDSSDSSSSSSSSSDSSEDGSDGSSTASDGCSKDADCDSGQVCVQMEEGKPGFCTLKCEGSSDSNCQYDCLGDDSSGYACLQGCASDGDCDNGGTCYTGGASQGVCIPGEGGGSDAGDGSSGSADDSCDESGTCGDTESGCLACAIAGPCKAAYGKCDGSEECKGFAKCVAKCTNGDSSCIDTCDSSNSGGKAIFDDYLTCMYCEACPVDCDSAEACGG